MNRDEAENAVALSAAIDAHPLGMQRPLGETGNGLGVQGNQIRRHIHNFDDA